MQTIFFVSYGSNSRLSAPVKESTFVQSYNEAMEALFGGLAWVGGCMPFVYKREDGNGYVTLLTRQKCSINSVVRV